MPLPSTYMRVQANYVNTVTGAKASCTFWYLPTSSIGTVTLANIVTFANDFKTAFTAALALPLQEDSKVASVIAKWVSGGQEFEAQNTNGSILGVAAGEQLPEEDVICIQRRTGKQGRSKRGRIFLPFISEEHQKDGALTDDGRAAAQAVATMVKNTLTANGVSMTPKTLDHKNGILETVVQAGYVEQTCSRRDRRYPKQLTAFRV